MVRYSAMAFRLRIQLLIPGGGPSRWATTYIVWRACLLADGIIFSGNDVLAVRSGGYDASSIRGPRDTSRNGDSSIALDMRMFDDTNCQDRGRAGGRRRHRRAGKSGIPARDDFSETWRVAKSVAGVKKVISDLQLVDRR